MKKHLLWLCPALLLGACDAPKIPISGARIPVVTYDNSVQVDADTKDMSITLPLPEMGRDWPQSGGDASHVIPHLSLGEELAPQWTTSIGSGNDEGRILSSSIVTD